ncbi:MAG TPA: OmpH family outer membrane protein [Pyrinomonadaceae bacterium]
MKVIRATAAVAFFVALTVASVSAQTRPAAGTSTQPGPTAPVTVSVPDSKVALIDSSAFADEKQGIAKFVSALKRVNAEFQPRQTELQNLQQQIEKAKTDLQKAAPVQDAKVTQQQQDKIAIMETDFKRKGEDAQAAFNKRLEEVLGPIYEDIGKALDVFAKARGITLILDVTKVQGIVSAADAMDITRAFIAEFNSKNPATASLTPPK